ncbi:MAG: carbonic anhydrase [Oscillospiraceae bacterium]|jgi:carbonic anhydrase|nr:carbonic anhydrase [Oscillospiraceae bacterium]
MFKNPPLEALRAGNQAYLAARANPGDISPEVRRETAAHGQHPFAAVVTCADSRVVPEHIFSAGLGALFVVRTAGNVVADFERGSLEYAVSHLGVPLILVMGHTHCGAVGAALETSRGEHVPPSLGALVEEIRGALRGETEEAAAVRANVEHSVLRVLESAELREFERAGRLEVARAVYDIETGEVHFF